VSAIEEAIKSEPRTPDLGGTANTTQVGEAIAARIAQG
jgi:tartrate dehydrogenase/decarboxylase/D-malate dehydrogenase